ncbi:hypothetical protein M1247_16205 [Mycobacterium sp. 21AC1]|uniref:hypothetical protein n=1 Tax=[Mycobacterium] appelbergii TaxID=2939269 RepID=UPI002939182E|nr:hypothetical protein [Mycobacterium sp. 21AC1]MDV3126466.1 hypothetical protein [Mycobacterium sp. 21AC1]
MTLAVLSGMLVLMTLVGVPAARADGIGSDAVMHDTQPLGGRELTVTVQRVDGHTAAQIPFLVAAQVMPPWTKASDYGFFAAGGAPPDDRHDRNRRARRRGPTNG